MAERYFVEHTLAPGLVSLEGPEAHHLAAVCRLRPGDAVRLFNGDGNEYPAQVVDMSRRHATLEVMGVETQDRELPHRVVVAAPLPKGDRAQFLVEKLTELGVAGFVPLDTARSVVHPRDARLDKLRRYVIEASKQCGRNVLMRVEPLTDWRALCERTDLPATRLVAHPGEAIWTPVAGDVSVAVGPEGGFTEAEIEQARAAGWKAVGLGARILRVETAAIVMAARSVFAA